MEEEKTNAAKEFKKCAKSSFTNQRNYGMRV